VINGPTKVRVAARNRPPVNDRAAEPITAAANKTIQHNSQAAHGSAP
jgi:hypothetical protein